MTIAMRLGIRCECDYGSISYEVYKKRGKSMMRLLLRLPDTPSSTNSHGTSSITRLRSVTTMLQDLQSSPARHDRLLRMSSQQRTIERQLPRFRHRIPEPLISSRAQAPAFMLPNHSSSSFCGYRVHHRSHYGPPCSGQKPESQ
jgi:hypothetical protein